MITVMMVVTAMAKTTACCPLCRQTIGTLRFGARLRSNAGAPD
jgi:hypothetical protein